LVPLRASFANTDAALTLVITVVAVAANGTRLPGIVTAVAGRWVLRLLPHPALRAIHDHLATNIEGTASTLVPGVRRPSRS
jgi:hypothetical protein